MTAVMQGDESKLLFFFFLIFNARPKINEDVKIKYIAQI